MAHQEKQVVVGWAARDTAGILSPFTFPLREKKCDDVTVKVLYCGICHTDLSTVTNEWGNANYPVVPGHEVVGVVTEVGNDVKKFTVGDKVGVGYMIGSCLSCDDCGKDSENYCTKMVCSFNSAFPDGTKTYGGFSDTLVVSEHFAVKIPDGVQLEKFAPLLCAGVTVYVPMKQHGFNKPGMHLGVVGLGGLGHLAVMFGKAHGMRVTVISSSGRKEKEAIEQFGADALIVSRNAEQMKAATGTMDGIIDTVSAVHPLVPLLALLKTHGKMIMIGGPAAPFEVPAYALISGGKSLTGSMIGGMKDTQEMVEFAAKHNVGAEVEVVGMGEVNVAMERLAKGDVRYRFVIDVANTITAT